MTNEQKTVSKQEIEQVQQEKTEYCLLGSFLRRRGTQIYGYNSISNDVWRIDIRYSTTIHLVPDKLTGKLIPKDLEAEKTFVDTRFIYFEAISLKHAKIRVEKWKQGKIKQLENMRPYDEELRKQLNFFK